MTPRSLLLLLLLVACAPAREDADPVDAGPDSGTDSGSDAGTDAGSDGGPICPETRGIPRLLDPRLVDDACVFDAWKAELPALSPAAQHERVAHFLTPEDFGSEVPLRSGNRVVFVAESHTAAPRVAGDFNGWDPTKGEMTALAQSGYFYREETVSTGRHAYKFVYDLGTEHENWVRDPNARWIEFDGVNTTGVGDFNSVVYTSGAALDRGLLRLVPAVPSTHLGNARDVYVLVPPQAFLPGVQAFPTLYVNDGNEMLSRAGIDRVADATFKNGTAPPLVLVFVALHDQAERLDDYTFGTSTSRGDAYGRFLAEELVPKISLAFPVKQGASERGVTGASLGGLISAYVAWQHPDVFGLVGSQSGSFFWPGGDDEVGSEEFRKLVEAAEKKPIRFYLDNGSPGDNANENARLAESLQAKGYDFTHVVEPGGQHDWSFWAKRWPGMVGWLY